MAHATTGVVPGLTREIRRELDAFARQLARARRGSKVGVHQARVASRRLREALPLASASGGIDAGDLTRALRRVTRALGGVREMDVARDVLRDAARTAHWLPTLVARVDRHCEQTRERRQDAMLKKLDQIEAAELSGRIEARLTAIDAGARKTAASVVFASRVRRRARALARAVETAGTLYAPEPLHRTRIAAKKLRYVLELARSAAGMSAGREMRQIRGVQTLLGSIHDLQVLQQCVEELASTSRLDRTTTRRLGELNRALETRCRELHAKYLKSAPELRVLAETMTRDLPFRLVKPRPGRMARMLSTRRLRLASGL